MIFYRLGQNFWFFDIHGDKFLSDDAFRIGSVTILLLIDSTLLI